MLIPTIVLACLSALLLKVGLDDVNASPLLVSDLLPLNLMRDPHPLSADQRGVVADLGYLDSFTLLFYDDDYGGTQTRLETRIYSARGARYTFVSGRFEDTQAFTPLDGQVLAIPYSPDQFRVYMSLEQVLAATSIDSFLLLPLEDELVPGGESYFADQLAFGLKKGQLVGSVLRFG